MGMESMQVQKERKNFSEASMEEQIERFKILKNLVSNESVYFDFLENIYKYSDKFKIDGMTPEQVADAFEEARGGNIIIKSAISSFLEIMKAKSKAPNQQDWSLEDLEGKIKQYAGNSKFADTEYNGLNIDKLVGVFKWSLEAWVSGGEKVGRNPTVSKEEIENFSNDLKEILETVNRFFGLQIGKKYMN